METHENGLPNMSHPEYSGISKPPLMETCPLLPVKIDFCMELRDWGESFDFSSKKDKGGY